jgi:hypothetical protein
MKDEPKRRGRDRLKRVELTPFSWADERATPHPVLRTTLSRRAREKVRNRLASNMQTEVRSNTHDTFAMIQEECE